MAQQGPNGVAVGQEQHGNGATSVASAGAARELDDDWRRANSDGSGRSYDSGDIRGREDGLEPHAHSPSAKGTPSHHFHPEVSSRSSTPLQSTNYSVSPGEHHQLRAGTAPGHEGFVQPSSYLRRGRGYSRPMAPPKPPETAVDREQRHSLVGDPCKPTVFIPWLVVCMIADILCCRN